MEKSEHFRARKSFTLADCTECLLKNTYMLHNQCLQVHRQVHELQPRRHVARCTSSSQPACRKLCAQSQCLCVCLVKSGVEAAFVVDRSQWYKAVALAMRPALRRCMRSSRAVRRSVLTSICVKVHHWAKLRSASYLAHSDELGVSGKVQVTVRA